MFKKIRFVASASLLYTATVGVSVYALATPPARQTFKTIPTPPTTATHEPSLPRLADVSDTPTHLSIPASSIDLIIDPGTYNPPTDTWTLSDTHAQFATITTPVNTRAGTTLIYGHATQAVLGKLAATTPSPGTIATITTQRGYKFRYTFVDSQTVSPSDTSVFDTAASGSPTLVVQTCTGTFSEWRTLYRFDFTGVDHP